MRMNLKYKRKINFKFKMLIVIAFIILLIFLFIKLSNNASRYILEYGKEEAYMYTSEIINNSVDDNTLKLISSDDLFKISRNSDNEIEMIDYNTYLVNIILRNIVNNLQEEIKNLENSVAFYIPFGIVFGIYLDILTSKQVRNYFNWICNDWFLRGIFR